MNSCLTARKKEMFYLRKPIGHISIVSLAFLFVSLFILIEGDTIEFRTLTGCTCPGYVSSYECHVVGGGFTVWGGTAFDCSLTNDEIILQHANFDSGTLRTCNSESIIGRSLRVTRNCYTSQLDVNITTDSELDGRNVECMYENPGTSEMLTIGSALISLTRDPFPPPSNILLIDVNREMLTFSWTSAASNCNALKYIINSNCGDCPQTTNQTYASCTLNQLPAGEGRCSFAVRSVVCDTIAGQLSSPINVTLKVPDAPIISSIVSKYGSNDKKKLIYLDIKWTKAISYNIFGEVLGGSPHYYTVIFSNTSMGQTSVCDSVNIDASYCLGGVCTASLPSHCYEADGNITVSVSATNVLGEGPRSTIYNIATTNQYVDVTFESASRVICEFLGPVVESWGERSCTISYGPCQQRLTITAEGSTSFVSNSPTVRIDIDTYVNTYCYSINASNGSFVWLIEGNYGNIMTSESPDSSTSSIILILALNLLFAILHIIVLGFCIGYRWAGPYSYRPVNIEQDSDSQELTKCLLKSGYEEKSDSKIVHAHISFDVEDKPQELTSALKSLNSQSETDSVNIKNINICGHASEKPQANLKTVYIECEDNLNVEEVDTIAGRIKQNRHVSSESVKVHMEAKKVQVPKDREHDSRYVKEIREVLEHKPGALGSLLEVFNATEECNHINITDIVVELSPMKQRNDTKLVTIKFIPELARDWKEKYNMKKHECEFFVPMPEEKTRSLSMSTNV